MEPDVLQTIVYTIGIGTIAGVYVKGKVRFSSWLDERFNFWQATLIYNGVTAMSIALVALVVWGAPFNL
jgi:hypothetical protein